MAVAGRGRGVIGMSKDGLSGRLASRTELRVCSAAHGNDVPPIEGLTGVKSVAE